MSDYRLSQAEDSLKVAKMCYREEIFKDAINRSYYAAFYSIKAVLALAEVDFKRHKDVIGYFNKTYVATELFTKDLGKKLGRLQQLREKSDYDDFFIVSRNDVENQIESAEQILREVKQYLSEIGGIENEM